MPDPQRLQEKDCERCQNALKYRKTEDDLCRGDKIVNIRRTGVLMDRETGKRAVFYRLLGLIFVVISLIIFITFFLHVKLGRYEDSSVVVDGWYDVTINATSYEHVQLSQMSFPPSKKGDHVTYVCRLPARYVPDAVLTLYLDHAAVKVYFQDRLVYRYGSPSSRMLGYGYVNVPLPDDYAGMQVRVELDLIEDEVLSSLTQPVIQNAREQLHNFVVDNSFCLVIDIAIIILSLTIMLIAFAFSGIMPSLRRLTFLGIAFFLMGLWEFCSYDLIWIFSDSLVFRGYMEYLALYVGPFFLALYFYAEFFRQESKIIRQGYRIIFVLQGSFPVIALILHMTDIVHLPGILPVCHILLALDGLVILFTLFRQILRKNYEHRSMAIGLVIIILLAIWDMARFNFYKYFMRENMEGFVSSLLLGFFLFLVAMLVDYFANQRRNLYKLAQGEAMEKLAHIDMMTGLANRRRCEELFETFQASGQVFGIISMDMNDLKKTNDNYGHQEGDRLLTDFAELLKSSCPEGRAIPVRMGGDEFVILFPQADSQVVDAFLKKLCELRDEINETRKPLPIGFAYGYCSSDDEELTEEEGTRALVEQVYRIADERMYESKSSMKAVREA